MHTEGLAWHVELKKRAPYYRRSLREVLAVLSVIERTGWTTAATLLMVLVLALSAAAFVAWRGAWGGKAEGNGSVTKYTSRTAGPYEVYFGTAPADPRVGRLHLTIRLTEASSEDTIAGADVIISGRGPGASEAEIGPLPTSTLPASPEDYDLDVELDRAGTWNFLVEVDAPLGKASAEFPLDVTKTSPVFGLLTLGMTIALLTIVGLSMRRYFAARRAQGRTRR